MLAAKYRCTLTEQTWLTPSVMRICFTTKKEIKFQPGQFLSIYVPDIRNTGKFLRRAYSFSTAPGKEYCYELCVKHVPGGAGTEFLASLQQGDFFDATAPYGHFLYQAPLAGRYVCFISTSTGIAPFRSMVLSEHFQENKPDKCFFIFGARTEAEIIFSGEFEARDINTINAISQPSSGYSGYHGRVTDYLRGLPVSWHWHNTDFYICGNAEMIQEVCEILKGGHGVLPKAIFCESFSTHQKKSDAA